MYCNQDCQGQRLQERTQCLHLEEHEASVMPESGSSLLIGLLWKKVVS